MDRCDLPVGTYVQVTPFPSREQDRPYRAKVVGYDVFRSKYELDREMWPGKFTDGGGGWWAFPAEVELVDEEALSDG